MTRFQLYRLLRRNQHLGYRRNPAFEQGQIAKVLSFLGAGLFIIYLIAIGTSFGVIAQKEGPGFLVAAMPFFLVIDFFLRFMVQQTPDMQVKPYILQPISKYAVIECFLLTSLTSTYNLLWLSMFLPYAIIVCAGGCFLLTALQLLVVCLLLIMLNSQFYLLARTLINRSQLWWFAILPVLALPFVPCLVWGIESVFNFYAEHGADIILLPAVVLATALLLALNRHLQFAFVYEEISKSADTRIRNVSSFSFLNRFGETGEYLKLEIKSLMRNKAIRARFWSSLVLIVIFCALIAYTPIYDGRFSANFWCFYCFALYGVTSLIKVMCPEGNYIDLLMTHRENILSLLRAKYYFHCAILAVPFLVMLPAVVAGKFTLLMMFGYLFLCSGLIYMILFELAVYNNQTMPLDQKLTGKGNIENGRQLIIELVALFLPIVLVAVLMLVCSETVAYLVMAVIGLVFTIAHPWWLRRVYRRMMHRKYVNLDGFHTTR